jgi:hypothetical protein
MEILIYIFAIYGLVFLIRDIDGPWGILSWLRSKLMQNKYVGVFFFKLLDCPYCSGWWAGIAIYLLSQKEWHLNLLICWGLASAIISLMLDRVVAKLND